MGHLSWSKPALPPPCCVTPSKPLHLLGLQRLVCDGRMKIKHYGVARPAAVDRFPVITSRHPPTHSRVILTRALGAAVAGPARPGPVPLQASGWGDRPHSATARLSATSPTENKPRAPVWGERCLLCTICEKKVGRCRLSQLGGDMGSVPGVWAGDQVPWVPSLVGVLLTGFSWGR